MFQVVREQEFAKRVQGRRKLLAKNQSECASEMGVSRQMWNNWELGFCKPKNQRMQELAAVLKCDPVWLQHGHGSELQKRIERVNIMMRDIVRELSHINQAIGRPKVTSAASGKNIMNGVFVTKRKEIA
jgi:transcriptional regulator with XRE-family HTH domain